MSVEVERFAIPTTAAQVRMLERVRRRTAARLAGRRVLVMPTLTSGAEVAGTLAEMELEQGDVVVLPGRPAANLAEGIRDCNCHVVWQAAVARPGLSRLLRLDAVVADVCLVGAPERVVAIVPTCGLVADKELDPGISAQRRRLGWASALADAVSADRRDSVGGALHARPYVPAR